jgi:hypothetical protein
MNFTLNRSKTVASKSGHCVVFVKDVPTFVVPEMWPEVLAIGALSEGDIPEAIFVGNEKEPTDDAVRYAELKAAVELLTLRNTREDFTAGGVPHLKPLADVLGWQVGAKERDAAVARMRASSGD